MIIFFLSLFLVGTIAGADNVFTYEQLVQKSDEFNNRVHPFPKKIKGGNRLKVIAGDNKDKQSIILEHAKNTRLIMHQKVLTLCTDFLNHKRKDGSEVEKTLYKDMTINQFIDRLILKRPLTFEFNTAETEDYYLGRNSYEQKVDESGDFKFIGTDKQSAPLLLDEYLSYDEMQISALIGVAGGTYFINKGDRVNCANQGGKGTYLDQGVYVGLVGARFEKPDFMEHEHIIIPNYKRTRTHEGLVHIWRKFYGIKENRGDYTEINVNLNKEEYLSCKSNGCNAFFDVKTYKKRLKYSILPFLFDAQARGLANNKKVYLHVVGLGLGVWQLFDKQAKFQIEVYEKLFKKGSCPANLLKFLKNI